MLKPYTYFIPSVALLITAGLIFVKSFHSTAPFDFAGSAYTLGWYVGKYFLLFAMTLFSIALIRKGK